MIKQYPLYPALDHIHGGNISNITNSFSVIFLSEGFKDIFEFDKAVVKVWKQLLEISPFNLINDGRAIFNATYFFSQDPLPNSQTIGPLYAPNGTPPATNRTSFNSYYYPDNSNPQVSYIVTLDEGKVYDAIKQTQVDLGFGQDPGSLGELVFTAVDPDNPAVEDIDLFKKNIVIVLYPYLYNPAVNVDGLKCQHTGAEGKLVFYFVPVNDTSGKFLARAIGEHMGLAIETSSQQPGPVSDIDKYKLFFAPNLVYLPTPPTSPIYQPGADFKWNNYLSNEQLNLGLTVHDSPTGNGKNISKAQTIGMWKGGGGFENNVYRSVENCLMRSDIKKVSERPKYAHGSFCPVCEGYLKRLLSYGYTDVFRKVTTLNNQILQYDRVKWRDKPVYKYKENIIYNGSFGAITGVSGEYWDFKVKCNSDVGLVIEDIKVRNQDRSSDRIIEKVMESISFENLSYQIGEDTTIHTIPISSIFSSGGASLVIEENGYDLIEGQIFQRGIKLSLEYEIEGCKMTIDLSVCFRGKLGDFDPGGAAKACKFYPQIGFTWNPLPTNPKYISNFYGDIKMICTTHHNVENPTCGGTNMNFVELFADSNNWVNQRRSHKYRIPVTIGPATILNPPAAPIAQWSYMFDYYKSLTTDDGYQTVGTQEWTVVHPANNSNYNKNRELSITFLPLASDPFTTPNFNISKVERQGAYDNFHITGDMGLHDYYHNPFLYDPLLTDQYHPARLLAAPFCAEDCIHLHVRWGLLGELLSTLFQKDRQQFKGWNSDMNYSVKGSSFLSPLVPPNQEIKFKIKNDDRAASSKTVYYRAKIVQPAAFSKNVIFEQGASYAVNEDNTFVLMLRAFFSLPWEDRFDSILLNNYEVLKRAYPRIRFVDPVPPPDIGNLVSHAVRTGIPVGNSNLENL